VEQQRPDDLGETRPLSQGVQLFKWVGRHSEYAIKTV
jgi:hypothetical protein